MNRKWHRIAMISVWMVICFIMPVFAAEKGTILSKGDDSENIYLYIPDPGEGAEFSCQIGTNSSETIQTMPIQDAEIPVKTYFLIDNSLSVTEQYRSEISDVLSQLAANRMDGELYTIITFSDQLNYLTENNNDYAEIKRILDTINYQDQETYLTDVLYELLKSFENQDNVFRRIVIVSDGVDNKTFGYTKEELYALLETSPCPIYTLGCTYKENQAELKNMFALSRMTGGQSWLLDDVSDPMEIVNGVAATNQVLKVAIEPRLEDCDGSEKGVFLKSTVDGRTLEYRTQMQMPFAAIEDIGQTDPVSETIQETSGMRDQSADELPLKKKGGAMVILAGVAVAVMGAGILVFFLRKGKKQTEFEAAPPMPSDESSHLPDERRTYFVGSEKQTSNEHVTHLAWESCITLEDQRDPKKSFSAPFGEGSVIIGYNRECQLQLNYDESVSGKHCEIFMENGTVKVRNLSKTNPTRLNGELLNGSEVLKEGDLLTLGRLNMKVKISI